MHTISSNNTLIKAKVYPSLCKIRIENETKKGSRFALVELIFMFFFSLIFTIAN